MGKITKRKKKKRMDTKKRLKNEPEYIKVSYMNFIRYNNNNNKCIYIFNVCLNN